MEKILNNLQDTAQMAKLIATKIQPGQVFAFHGDLGAGKTTLIQLIAKELGVTDPVTSPTFVIQKIYPTNKGFQLVHIDCYRFNNSVDANQIGLDEFFNNDYVCFIEWAEKIKDILPKNTINIKMSYIDENSRQIEMKGLNV